MSSVSPTPLMCPRPWRRSPWALKRSCSSFPQALQPQKEIPSRLWISGKSRSWWLHWAHQPVGCWTSSLAHSAANRLWPSSPPSVRRSFPSWWRGRRRSRPGSNGADCGEAWGSRGATDTAGGPGSGPGAPTWTALPGRIPLRRTGSGNYAMNRCSSVAVVRPSSRGGPSGLHHVDPCSSGTATTQQSFEPALGLDISKAADMPTPKPLAVPSSRHGQVKMM